MRANQSYSSTNFGYTGQHLAWTIWALASLNLDGTGISIINLKATLTNCAGQ